MAKNIEFRPVTMALCENCKRYAGPPVNQCPFCKMKDQPKFRCVSHFESASGGLQLDEQMTAALGYEVYRCYMCTMPDEEHDPDIVYVREVEPPQKPPVGFRSR